MVVIGFLYSFCFYSIWIHVEFWKNTFLVVNSVFNTAEMTRISEIDIAISAMQGINTDSC